MSFLMLPAEIRLQIYGHVFAPTMALVEAGMQEQKPSLIPAKATITPLSPCSGQLLRVSQLIKQEAEPIFYAKTHFITITQGFAGILPSKLTSGFSCASRIKHLTWQLNCDFMKHYYQEEMEFVSHELRQLDSLDLRIQAENWKDSFCGEWVDREAFVRGRGQMIAYAQDLQALMNEGCARKTWLVEDRSGLGRGRVVLKLTRSKDTITNGLLID